MNWPSVTFDWNQARAFLATAEEGSLSAAARALGQTQPTLSRQVAGLEEDLGVTLFERIGRSLELTQQGQELLEHFRAMGDAANQVSLSASGQSQAIAGDVTITASDAVAALYLPAVVRELKQAAPEISVHVIATNEVRDLRRREADIALRHVRPEEPDLIARLLTETRAHFYASQDLLDQVGPIREISDLRGVPLVGFNPIERLLERLQGFGIDLDPSSFQATTDNGIVLSELIRAGVGIGFLPDAIAERTPGLVQVLPESPEVTFPVWLITHREIHTSRRIRVVFDHLARAFTTLRLH